MFVGGVCVFMCVKLIRIRMRSTLGKAGGGEGREKERGAGKGMSVCMLVHVCGNPYIAVWQQRSIRQ